MAKKKGLINFNTGIAFGGAVLVAWGIHNDQVTSIIVGVIFGIISIINFER